MNKQRFIALWSRSPIEGIDASAVFKLLEQHYAEPQRYYHNAAHIDHCLAQFDNVAAEISDPEAIELAIWFHDVIYDPKADDNEQKSAELFQTVVGKQRNIAFVSKVVDLIELTFHRLAPLNTDQQYILDIDLSSFGLPWELFSRDSQNIRREHSHLSDEEFARSHLSFLHGLLKRPQFFHSNFFQQHYGDIAIKNITQFVKGNALTVFRPLD